MTRVDFYVLVDGEERARLTFACRIAEKAYTQAHRVYVHAASAADAARFDELLWTFRDASFVPHALAGTQGPVADTAPVLVGHDAGAAGGFLDASGKTAALLINLNDDVPVFYERFARVAELVDSDAARRRRGRERFRHYRERGCALETHTLSAAHG